MKLAITSMPRVGSDSIWRLAEFATTVNGNAGRPSRACPPSNGMRDPLTTAGLVDVEDEEEG